MWVLALNLGESGGELAGARFLHAVGGVERLFCLKALSRVCDDDLAHVIADPYLGNGLRECFNRSGAQAVEGMGGDPRNVAIRFGPQQGARNSEVTFMVFECF